MKVVSTIDVILAAATQQTTNDKHTSCGSYHLARISGRRDRQQQVVDNCRNYLCGSMTLRDGKDKQINQVVSSIDEPAATVTQS